MPEKFVITASDGRPTEFTGDVLADASTDNGESWRWVEFTIYRTVAGNYVVRKATRSMLFHADGSDCLSPLAKEKVKLGELFANDPDWGWTPCPRCILRAHLDIAPEDDVMKEVDKIGVAVYESNRADRLVKSIEHPVSGFNKPFRDMLDRAAEQDEGIKAQSSLWHKRVVA